MGKDYSDIAFKDDGRLKLLIIVGTRPEIIRLSEVIKLCRRHFDCLLAHTGQNYDYTLNGIFFRDLGLADPDAYMDAVGGATIVYRVNCGPLKDGKVMWQVTNTGDEAMRVCCRGGFEIPNIEKTSRREETAYTGKHYVQCFVIRRGYCVRWSKPFFINVE